MTLSHLVHGTVAAALLALMLPTSAFAGSPPSGSISCSVFSIGSSGHPSGILFKPGITNEPRTVLLKGINNGGSCDNSGVSGGKAPITGVAFKLTARMEDGTCTKLTTTPTLENARLKFRWRGVNPAGHFMTVATSKARIATTSYDLGTHSLIVTTEPLIGNAFLGKTVTLQLGFDSYVAELEGGCQPSGGFVGVNFGEHNAATLDLQ